MISLENARPVVAKEKETDTKKINDNDEDVHVHVSTKDSAEEDRLEASTSSEESETTETTNTEEAPTLSTVAPPLEETETTTDASFETPSQGASVEETPTSESSMSESTHQSTEETTASSEEEPEEKVVGDTILYLPNYTTQQFIQLIGEQARQVAWDNDLYASVMIAQAILESASGSSTLSAPPNYNLFGIKGSFKGKSVEFATKEDDGSGKMFTIRAAFRKYRSYKDSLQDYADLLRSGVEEATDFYQGVWKSKTKSYKDATKFLTGRYATDTNYAAKLNGLILAYQLTDYDQLAEKKETPPKKEAKAAETKTVTETKKPKTATKQTKAKLDQQLNSPQKKLSSNDVHIVQKGDSLRAISEVYEVSILAILDKNQLDRRMLFVGQKLLIPQDEKISEAIREEIKEPSLQENETQLTKPSPVKKATATYMYHVRATRKKTEHTYEVKRGDTLLSIAQKTGVSVSVLKQLNHLDRYVLKEGQLLILSPYML